MIKLHFSNTSTILDSSSFEKSKIFVDPWFSRLRSELNESELFRRSRQRKVERSQTSFFLHEKELKVYHFRPFSEVLWFFFLTIQPSIFRFFVSIFALELIELLFYFESSEDSFRRWFWREIHQVSRSYRVFWDPGIKASWLEVFLEEDLHSLIFEIASEGGSECSQLPLSKSARKILPSY